MCVHYQCNIWIYVFDKHTIFGSCHNINGNFSRPEVGLLLAILLAMDVYLDLDIGIVCKYQDDKFAICFDANTSIYSNAISHYSDNRLILVFSDEHVHW